jgi:hypothetical protein
MSTTAPIPYAEVHALTEAVLRAGVMLSDLLGNLLEDLPEDAFAGESHVDVLVEMMTGTIAPVADAAGAATVHDTTALLGAVCDRVVADLRAALDLARDEP